MKTKINKESFVSRKFIMMIVIFIVSCIFLWFEKIGEKSAIIVWLTTGFSYGMWNILEKLISNISIRNILSLDNTSNVDAIKYVINKVTDDEYK